VGLLGKQIAPFDQCGDRGVDHAVAPIWRKFSTSVRPCGVSTDSG
jgi:hypothetical protein